MKRRPGPSGTSIFHGMRCNINCITYICLTSIGTPILGTALGIAAKVKNKANTYNSYPEGPPHLMTHRPCLGLKETAFQVQKSIFHPVPGYMEPQTSSRQSVPVRNFWSMAAKRQFTLGFHSLGSTYFPLPVQGRGHRPQHLAGPEAQKGRGKHQGGRIRKRAGGYRK